MSEASVFDSYPDISFIDDMSLSDAMEQMKGWYEEKYREITGDSIVLHDADPEKLRMDTISYMYYQVLIYLDFMAKQNLLKYSTNGFLDNIGARCGMQRNGPTAATVTIRFTLSSIRESATIIPAGTRCTSGDDVFFEVIEDREIPPGDLSLEVRCLCTEPGEVGNEYVVGEINDMVDVIPYVQSVYNVTESSGGTDEENDEDFAERIFLKPSTYSTTGVEDAYIYWTKTADGNVGDVKVMSPEPSCVNIYFVLKNGELPGDEMIAKIYDFLSEKNRKGLCEKLTVYAPNAIEFDLDFTYYINESDRKSASMIQAKVSEAVDSYKKWQCEKIGRDINPYKLEELLMNSGIKRPEIRSPKYQKVSDMEIPKVRNMTFSYGGFEDD